MKFPNKRELQQTSISDIEFKNLIDFYKKFTAKRCSLLLSDTTLASDNHLR